MPQILHLDPELASKAEALFNELGLDLSTAVHLFLRQSLRESGLPFTLRLHAPAPVENVAVENVAVETPGTEAEAAPAPVADEPALFAAQNTAADAAVQVEPLAFEAEDEEALPEVPAEVEEVAPFAEAQDADRDGQLSDPRQVFHDMKLIGAPLRRIRSLNQLYAIGEANPHVQGWREVYVSGDEPFALDFGTVRVELGWQNGGSIRMMDGRLPDEVLESDAVFPRELSPVFSSVIGQRLVDVSSTRVRRGSEESEQLRLRFANGSTLTFSPGENWAGLWLSDAHGSVMYAPDAVWRRVLGERAWQSLR